MKTKISYLSLFTNFISLACLFASNKNLRIRLFPLLTSIVYEFKNENAFLLEKLIYLHIFWISQDAPKELSISLFIIKYNPFKDIWGINEIVFMLYCFNNLSCIFDYIEIFIENYYSFLIFIILQTFLITRKGKFALNLRRKLFHFLLFSIFYRNNFKYYLTYIRLIVIVCLFSSSSFSFTIYKHYIRKNELKTGVFAHAYLLLGSTLPLFVLEKHDYYSLLISICIMDSFASIIPQFFGYFSHKTLIGLFYGQIFSIAVEYFINNRFNFLYHTYMGNLEYFCKSNDNLIIPYFGTFFLIMKKCFNK